ncbi:MAG: hypothetical protein K2L89_05780 [Muribaculaceae bacterium]|nr:hypothetical protein [Muribaculaceae bacterium]
MNRFFLIIFSTLIISLFQSCFKEENNGFIKRVAFDSKGGTLVINAEASIFSIDIGEGDEMDRYHSEYIEPDSIIAKSEWLTVKSRVGSQKLIITVDSMNKASRSDDRGVDEINSRDNDAKRFAPVTIYSGGYEYAVIWIFQFP